MAGGTLGGGIARACAGLGATVWSLDVAPTEHAASGTVRERVGTVEDIVHAALFLSSSASGLITGHTVIMDGGLSLR